MARPTLMLDLHPDSRGGVYLDGVHVPKVRAIRLEAGVDHPTRAVLELVAVGLDVPQLPADVTVEVYRLERSWWDRAVNAWRRFRR